MEIKNLTCIGCPLGCQISVKLEGGEILDITGYTCGRGKEYASAEVTSPVRMVTSTIKVNGGAAAVVSVKTASDIPKEKIFDVMAEIRSAQADAPVKAGDILISNAAQTGVNIIATSSCPVISE